MNFGFSQTFVFFPNFCVFPKSCATIHPSANKLVRITGGLVASGVSWEVPSDCRPLYIDRQGQTFIGCGRFPEAKKEDDRRTKRKDRYG